MALRSLLHGEICSFWETSQGKNRTSVNLGKKIFFCELIFCQRGENICLLFQFLQNFWWILFVKGTFSCESAICINKSVHKLFPEKVKFKKKDYHFRTEVVQLCHKITPWGCPWSGHTPGCWSGLTPSRWSWSSINNKTQSLSSSLTTCVITTLL